MNCTDCQNKFTEILDHDMPGDMTTAFKAHLATCPTCASEFQGFKKTVQSLQLLPQEHVPADFLIGINEKLDATTFARLKNWFAFMGQHKVTASATMATLIVGVISATILQITPTINQTELKNSKTTYSQAITTQHETQKSENNYYPGVPYLNNSQTAKKTTRPNTTHGVQFASTNPRTTSAYYGIQSPRGSPENYRTSYTSLNSITNPTSDFHITIHPASTTQQHAITQRIVSNTNWETHLHNSTLFVTLANQQLPEFQKIFPPSAPPHKKLDLTPLTRHTEQHLFTITISFK